MCRLLIEQYENESSQGFLEELNYSVLSLHLIHYKIYIKNCLLKGS